MSDCRICPHIPHVPYPDRLLSMFNSEMAKSRNPLVNLVKLPRSCRSLGYVAKMVGINWSSVSEIISETIWSIIASEIDVMIFHAIFILSCFHFCWSQQRIVRIVIESFIGVTSFYRSDDHVDLPRSLLAAQYPMAWPANARGHLPLFLRGCPARWFPVRWFPVRQPGMVERRGHGSFVMVESWNLEDVLLDRKISFRARKTHVIILLILDMTREGERWRMVKGRVDNAFRTAEGTTAFELSEYHAAVAAECEVWAGEWWLKRNLPAYKTPIELRFFCRFYQKGNCMSVLSQLFFPTALCRSPHVMLWN